MSMKKENQIYNVIWCSDLKIAKSSLRFGWNSMWTLSRCLIAPLWMRSARISISRPSTSSFITTEEGLFMSIRLLPTISLMYSAILMIVMSWILWFLSFKIKKKKQGLKAFLCVLESKSSSHLLFLERIHPLWQLPNLSGHWQFLSAKVKSWASPSVLILFQPERLCCWPLLQSWYGPEFCIHKSYKLLSFFEDTLHVLGLAPNPLHRTEITSCTSASLFFIESCKSLKSKLSRCEMWPQNQPPTTSGLFY